MCEHCLVVYSFFFGVQFHKIDCPVVRESNINFVLTSKELTSAHTFIGEFLGRELAD